LTPRHADVVRALVGMVPRVSHWVAVDQTSVDGFADATGDHQWIHVGRERATRDARIANRRLAHRLRTAF
jgi:acyl dehydratase